MLLQKNELTIKKAVKEKMNKKYTFIQKYQNCKAYTSLLVVTLNVDRLNFPNKCCRMSGKTVSNYMMVRRDPFLIYGYANMGLSWWLSSKESTCNAGDTG